MMADDDGPRPHPHMHSRVEAKPPGPYLMQWAGTLHRVRRTEETAGEVSGLQIPGPTDGDPYATLPACMPRSRVPGQAIRTVCFARLGSSNVKPLAHHLSERGRQRGVSEGTRRTHGRQPYGVTRTGLNAYEYTQPFPRSLSHRLPQLTYGYEYDRYSNASPPRGAASSPPARRIAHPYILVAPTPPPPPPLARTGHAAASSSVPALFEGGPISNDTIPP